MVDTDLAEQTSQLLATAILALVEGMAESCAPLPVNSFQRRMRLAALADAGRDISTLATAAVVMLRRSRMEFPPA